MNKTWILNNPKTLQVTTNSVSDIHVTVHYADIISNAFTEGSSLGYSNSTTPYELTTPPVGYSRVIRNVTVFNPNTTTATGYISIVNAGTTYEQDPFSLAENESTTSGGSFDAVGKLKISY